MFTTCYLKTWVILSFYCVSLCLLISCRCLEVEESLRNQLEYTQQLLLSALLDICSYLSTQGIDTARGLRMEQSCVIFMYACMCTSICTDLLDENQFNIELVVQCIRLSSNPQTHHHALLLLSTASTIFPVSPSIITHMYPFPHTCVIITHTSTHACTHTYVHTHLTLESCSSQYHANIHIHGSTSSSPR